MVHEERAPVPLPEGLPCPCLTWSSNPHRFFLPSFLLLLLSNVAQETMRHIMRNMVILRHRRIDDLLQEWLEEDDSHRQVVCMGAGLDARPYRLPFLPEGTTWFELDVPEVLFWWLLLLLVSGQQDGLPFSWEREKSKRERERMRGGQAHASS